MKSAKRLDKASEQFTQAHDLIQELMLIEDSPDLQELLGVTFTVHGEVLSRLALLHAPGQRRTRDSRVALEATERRANIQPFGRLHPGPSTQHDTL